MEMRGTLYYKSKLDTHDQKVYDDLFEQWTHFERMIRVREPHCGIETLIAAIRNDYPLVFFVDFNNQLSSYYQMASYVWWNASYLFEKEQAKQLLDRCEKWGNYIISKKPAKIKEAELALWLHDVIISNSVYSDENGNRAHSLIGVICDGKAVCDGDSYTYKYLCDLAEIPCIVVLGTINGTPHAWNMIWINNEPAFVDVTNDRGVNGKAGRGHFLRNTNEMIGYTWDEDIIPKSRIRNKSDVYLIAHNESELNKLARKYINSNSLAISLEFGRPLSGEEIKKMATALLAKRSFGQSAKFSYTIAPPTIFIG